MNTITGGTVNKYCKLSVQEFDVNWRGIILRPILCGIF